ncbi:RNA polymerase, sigma-24 subunit, ECF subfamily [Pseudopedobacter saltans DSM 12145]|uniref:RNA polymerase, sigma-24 subunit, ECF subfamily n=1 Tax=Pseudopedobacter saltans (strain ATCC 51119 / DSM 12145 / JCM 21818 / CCUG 39354 / LMG 10337 / NBRC 100064 / NCIMB 13643) TaxID=762903 RepID=F0SC76_PSESL|nr:sigma-70 family RNA polymerase sigma factor [Pseudopedobacter saltans]ADY51673.1 RNA polymerase, sigma-24 subunit, ECF subfamily [Pseudopedobacter saltans DSM 12145]
MSDFIVDGDILSRLKSGDEAAFSLIYKAFWKELFNAAYKRLKDIEQSQDIVQNVFISLWDRREVVDINNIEAYLHTSVKFQVFKHSARSPDTSEFLSAFENILVSPVSPENSMLEKEILGLVKLWIDALPKKRREIFLLHYHDGLTTAEIADLLKVSRKTVQNQLNTASTHLRLRLTQILSLLILLHFK